MYVIAKVRIVKDPRNIKTKSNVKMVTTFGFADIDGESGLPISIVAFGNLADELAKYRSGDNIRVSGLLKENNYVNKQGEDVHGYQIIVDAIAGIKSSRGKFSVPKQASQEANQASADFQDSTLPDSF